MKEDKFLPSYCQINANILKFNQLSSSHSIVVHVLEQYICKSNVLSSPHTLIRKCILFATHVLLTGLLSTIQQLSPLVTEKINITNLTPPSVLCLFQARIWISNVLCRGLFCVCLASCFWWEVIVCFVDIGGIVYRHCLNFPSNKWTLEIQILAWNRHKTDGGVRLVIFIFSVTRGESCWIVDSKPVNLINTIKCCDSQTNLF
jgi:hypothetical protein